MQTNVFSKNGAISVDQIQFGQQKEGEKNNYAVVKLRSYADFWSLWRDSNLRPAHYEWAALPAVLHKHNNSLILILYIKRETMSRKNSDPKRDNAAVLFAALS